MPFPSHRVALLATAVALLGATPASAGPPIAGLVIPGTSLGGLKLGATKRQVERIWGSAYGVCTGCARETWYFNYYAFQPRGTGVEFRNGRAIALFTVHSPSAWHTGKGLALGEPVAEITALYGALARLECGTYYALLFPRGGSVTVFYVLHDRLWAFGLSSSGVPICR